MVHYFIFGTPIPSHPRAHILTHHVARADTEAILARRLSKFLGGCDSFYDEPPLVAVMPPAAKVAASAPAPQEKTHPVRDKIQQDAKYGPSKSTPVAFATIERLARRTRPFPNGDSDSECFTNGTGGGQGEVGVAENPSGLGQGNFAEARHSGSICSRPAKKKWRKEGADSCSKLDETRWGMSAAVPGETTTGGEHNKLLAEEKIEDICMAPSFLTPPVIGVATTGGASDRSGSSGDGVAGLLPGGAPPSASSSAGSTPSNYLSPALAVASPLAQASRNTSAVHSGSDNLGRKSGSACGSSVEAAALAVAPASEDRHSSLSTQEGSVVAGSEEQNERGVEAGDSNETREALFVANPTGQASNNERQNGMGDEEEIKRSWCSEGEDGGDEQEEGEDEDMVDTADTEAELSVAAVTTVASKEKETARK